MATYQITGPDGKKYRVTGDTPEGALAALQKMLAPREPNRNPGVSPDAPPEMIYNPNTGQYTSRELLANSVDMGTGEAFITGAGRGATFGGIDEAVGGVNALVPGAGTPSERYTFGREVVRAREDAAREAAPIATTAGEITGGVSTALAYGLPAWAQGSAARNVLGGMAVGGGEGLLYGGLSGEGGGMERAENMVKYGLLGAGAGGLFPLATSAARGGARMVGDMVSGGVERVVGKGSKSRADRALASTLERSGMSPDDVAAALRAAQDDGQGAFTVADALGQAGQRRISGIVRGGGDASQEVADYLRQRQLDQPDRMSAAVRDAFGFNPQQRTTGTAVVPEGYVFRDTPEQVLSRPQTSAARTEAALRKARRATADKAFADAAADAAPVDVRGAVSQLDDTIGKMTGSGIEPPPVVKEFRKWRRRLAGQTPDGQPTTLSDYESVLANYRAIRDRVDELYDAKQGNVADALKPIRDSLEQALSDSSDGFRKAQADYRVASGVIDAVEEGADMVLPGSRAVDNVGRFSGMSPTEKAAARIGYGDRVLSKVEGAAGEMTNRARPFTSAKARAEAAEIALNPDRFLRQVDRENVMHETLGRALGGSRTADNLEDIADLAPYDASLLFNVITGNWRAAAQQGAQSMSSAFTGMNPETRKILARALLAQDESALRRALSQAKTSDARKQIVDAILRVSGQRTGYAGLVEQ